MIGGAITITALIAAIEELISNAESDSPLFDAEAKASFRYPVDSSAKIVRVDVTEYIPNKATEDCRKELNAQFIIECWQEPESEELDDLIAAVQMGSQMAFAIFEGLDGSNLGGQATVISIDAIEPGDANIQAGLKAASYIYGTANPLGEG